MEKRELEALAAYTEEMVRMYIAAHETGFHNRVAGEPLAQYRDRYLSLASGLADPLTEDKGLSGIGDFVEGKNVILYGGAPSANGSFYDEDSPPVVVRTNNHYLWQQDQSKCSDGIGWTDGVYHGSGYTGLFAQFVNVPPLGLKFIAQNMGHRKPSFATWARREGVYYANYGSFQGQEWERGVDPAKYEDVFKPLIKVCEQPFTGVLAAFHLLNFPIKSLYLTGFDFYIGREHVNNIREGGREYRGEHSLDDNREAMRRVLDDRRCKPDGLLRDSLQ